VVYGLVLLRIRRTAHEGDELVRLSWIRELPEDGKLREQWDALVLESEQPEVFLTWEWAAAVAQAYGSTLQPWIATAYEGEDLVGVAALARSSTKEAVFLAGTTADYCDFVSRPAIRQEFVDQVLYDVNQAGIRSVVLANLPADSATVAALNSNRLYKSFLRTGYACGQVRFASEQEREWVTQSLLKKKKFRRSLDALDRLGPVTLRHDFGDGLPGSGLDEFYERHVARFLATGRLSNLVMKERRKFLSELARLLGERGWFDLMNLWAGDRLVGSNYGFQFQGSWFWYCPTIVNEFEDLSPGICLLAKVVEDAVHNPEVHLVDLGLGTEGYKERFANAERTTLHATLNRSTLVLLRARGRYHAATAIMTRPRLESLMRRAQQRVRLGKQHVRENGWISMLACAGQRLRRSLVSTDEVRLFQWQNSSASPLPHSRLVSLSWEILSAAAIRYSEDNETLDYLLRSAQRFRSPAHAGFALLGEDDIAQQFAWVAPYQGFAVPQLGEVLLHAPSSESVMIFDCWTPREIEGHGLFVRTIEQLAARLSAVGKDVWIFSAADPALLAAFESSGFRMQSFLVKRKVLSWSGGLRDG
jgi:CelD/BcsL family acetyltransferase involved in cellulose biosynthesis